MRSAGAIAGISLCVLTAVAARGEAAPSAGRAPTGSAGARCATCHASEAREWEASRHHGSYRDPAFQEAYKDEHLAFCVRCHAPGAPPSRGEGYNEGIGCEDCHTRVAAHALDPVAAARPGTRPCAGCHSFDFAGEHERMQRTAEEHRASAARATRCEACHMPAEGGHARAHDFAAWRDPSALRAALAVDSVTRTPQGVDVTLRAVGVGHALPTGDLFRALRVHLWTEDARGSVLSDDVVWLERSFDGHGGARHREVADTRLTDAPRRLSFVTSESPRRAHVIVSYERVMSVQAGIRTVFDSTVLADAATEFSP